MSLKRLDSTDLGNRYKFKSWLNHIPHILTAESGPSDSSSLKWG